MNHQAERTRVALIALDGQVVPDWVRQTCEGDGIDLACGECTSRAELAERAAQADVVWLFSGSRIWMDGNLAAVPRCRAILRTGSGTDNVPIEEATRRGIIVANTPTAFNDAVADHVVALMLATARRIGELDRSMRDGLWEQATATPLSTIQRRTLGLVGFGHIGQLVAGKLRGFEMPLLVHDPFVANERVVALGAKPVELKSLLSQSDFISLHCPLTPKTNHLIGEAELRSMKRTAILINTSRGPVVDEPALIRALQEGWITAAGLDVFEEEPPATDNPLLRLDNVVMTPHSAGYSPNGMELRWRVSLESLGALARYRWPPSCVNPQVRPAGQWTR